MKLSFSKREKILGLIFIITISIAIFEVLDKRTNINNSIDIDYTNVDAYEENISKNIFNEDIIIKIESEIKNIVTVNSITKYESSTPNNIQICISDKIDNILKVEEKLKSIGIENNIKKIEIIKNNNTIDSKNEKSIDDNVDCILEIELI